MTANELACLSCRSNDGVERISPGPVIYEGRGWLVEHAYPSSLLGWLVIVLRRHATALHELTQAEATELGQLQRAVARVLHTRFGTEKEYAICYGEAPGFSHLHTHMVPRDPTLPREQVGGGVFVHLRSPDAAVAPEQVADLCRELRGPLRRVVKSEGAD